jgi:hypothetical protein
MDVLSADATAKAATARLVPTRGDRLEAVIPGLALAAFVPAGFWAGMIWLGAKATGVEIATLTLVSIAGAIALFLTVVCGAIMLRE